MMKTTDKIGLALSLIILIGGCGTTKFSDTTRTATEQLLISSAMEDVVDEFNFYPLSGRKIFIKADGVSATDKEYLLSILRQQLAANGVLIQEEKAKADYILEVSTGAVGTDRCELIYGTKETSVPSMLTMGVATTIPEFALAKRTDQKAKIKLTMWAYNQETGAIVWQSGQKNKTASVRDRWIFGVGPITKSSFNDKTQIGGDEIPFEMGLGERIAKDEKPSVRTEATYRELDHDAIDHLEKIRKDGLEAMSFDLSDKDDPAEKESEKKGGTEKAETGQAKTEEKKSDAVPQPDAKEEDSVKSKPESETLSAPVPETAPAVLPSAATTPPSPVASTATSTVAPTATSTVTSSASLSKTSVQATSPSEPETQGQTVPSAPTSSGEDFPVLEFDDLTLSVGKTIVPTE